MGNWALMKEEEVGLPVAKRAIHGIHFKRPDGLIQAEFVGKPCHYFDGKEYKAIDTRPLLRKDGTFGCAHSDVIIHTDGTVQVGDYTQRAALIYPGKISVDGDRIARPFSGGVQYLYITETGFRQEIVLEKMPDLRKVSALVDTVKGILPTKYTASALSLKDSSTAELSDFVQFGSKSLASVLEAAKYPVVIDPDFAVGTADCHIAGLYDGDYATARSTSTAYVEVSTSARLGQTLVGTIYVVYRLFVLFDTSSIGAGSTVTQANLTLTTSQENGKGTFTYQIVKHDWSAYAADLTNATNRETAYDACLSGTADDSYWAIHNNLTNNTPYTSGNLSTAWVSKTGTTYYSLRSSNDYDGTAPTGSEYLKMCLSDYATESYRPVLSVTYTAGASGKPYYYYAQQQ